MKRVLIFLHTQLFSHGVCGISLVVADVLDHVGVGEEFKLQGKRPGFSIRPGIVNGDLDIHMAEVAAAEALDGVKGFSMRTAAVIEPAFVVEAAGIDNEPFAVPLSDGVAQPRRITNGAGPRPSVKI